VLLHSLNGNFLPVKDPGGQSGFHISLFKHLTEVFNLSGTGGGNDWDGNVVPIVVDQFDARTSILLSIYTYISGIASKIPNGKLSYPQLFFLKQYVTHIASLSN
jgi:hypothetical protein